MFNCDEAVLYTFANCIFSNLEMAKAFCGGVARPGDTGFVVIVDGGRRGHDGISEIETLNDKGEVKKAFGALVGGVDFGFCRAPGCD